MSLSSFEEVHAPPSWLHEGLPPQAVGRATQLGLAEAALDKVVIDLDSVVRIKVNDRCGNTCWFCHNEGTEVAAPAGGRKGLAAARQSIYITDATPKNGRFVPGEVQPTEAFDDTLHWLADEMQIDKVQLTGGEPPLHRKIVPVVEAITRAGMQPGMTANGERGGDGMRDLADAGLQKVNFSIYGLTVPEFLQTQSAGFPERLAAQRISQLHDAVAGALATPMSVRANMVVTPDGTDRMRRALDELDPRVLIRFQPELRQQRAGMLAIRSVLAERGAHPVRETISAGSSNRYITYQLPDGREAVMKHFRRSRLDVPGICNGCPIDARGACDEGFYGLRLYADRLGGLWAGVCMQRMELTRPVEQLRQQRGLVRLIAEQPAVDIHETYRRLIEVRGDRLREVMVRGRHGATRLLPLPGEPHVYDLDDPAILAAKHGDRHAADEWVIR